MVPRGQLSLVLGRLRTAACLREAADLTDGQLLERYVAQRDEAAFEALVRRHGPMVLGVCRRLLHSPQDVEDAFQATFLILVRKAAAVRPRHKVGSWLYGVAYHAAQKARAAAVRRGVRERQVRDMPEPATVAAGLWHDLVPLLDQELSRLPDKYRLPLVLCDLEGQTRKEAARQLGWPEGTVAGRLAGGRALLARRLTRHGLPLSGGVLAAVLAQHAVAAVPLPLVQATARAAGLLAGGQLAAAGLASTPAAAITDAVLKAMLLGKLKVVTAVVLVLAIAGSGVGVVTHGAWADHTGQAVGQQSASHTAGPMAVAPASSVVMKDRAAAPVPPARNAAAAEAATAPWGFLSAVIDRVANNGHGVGPRATTKSPAKEKPVKDVRRVQGPQWFVGGTGARPGPKETEPADRRAAHDAGITLRAKGGFTLRFGVRKGQTPATGIRGMR
jgi:RNA polymerase sigma factor (sigma-70 family)